MKLIAGLGNPGPDYDGTRHNVGFMVVDAVAQSLGTPVKRKKFNALTAEAMCGDEKLLFLKPQQFMNRSGHAVATAAGFYRLTGADILVVTDDLALPTGQLRLRAQGSAGGHNGLKDIISALGTQQFARLRIGIGDAGRRDTVDYVLSRFTADERDVIGQAVATAAEAVRCWVTDGIEAAMTRYNAKNRPQDDQQQSESD